MTSIKTNTQHSSKDQPASHSNDGPRKRDLSIDFLRFVGISCIILAHSSIPKLFLFQLRNFDVPLMVFISGYCAMNFSTKSDNFFAYTMDRVLRLIIPTWIFLTLYFLIRMGSGSPVSIIDIKLSYLMIGGPVGVWVIRILFFMSLLTPLVVALSKKKLPPFSLFIFLIVNELIIFYFNTFQSTLLTETVSILLVYNFSYLCILVAGSIMNNLTKKQQIEYAIGFFIIFCLFILFFFYKENGLRLTQRDKYPPTLYYFSYALLATFFLFIIKDYQLVKKISQNKTIGFIGSHTLWIYLWHWIFVHACFRLFHSTENWNWVLNFLICYMGGTVTTYIQSILVEKFIKKNTRRQRILHKIFTG